ncbi:MAG TPA: efflux RND transporter periplasmic adaptor subunit [Hyphomicrobiales bacterium]|nr:efflux RND transporter periplasmic adaptor subunit [Hyphomicrobiales bacterium]
MRKIIVLSGLALLALAPLLAACDSKSQAQKAPPAPPPPHVDALAITPHPVPLSYAYAGRVAAFREVEVRARVSGILVERDYVEGGSVKAGDVLFRIDPAPYQADLAKAKAQVALAQAQLDQAQRDLARNSALFAQKIASEKTRDDSLSAVETAKATLAGARAQLQTAEINLGYTTVKAPVDGVTSTHVMPDGSLVGTGQNDSLLTSITQLDPVYVNFAFTETELNEVRRFLDSGAAKLAKAGPLPVKLVLGDGTVFPQEGHVDFTGSTVDQQTGTIPARAIVPNPGHRLIPGQFVRAVVGGIVLQSAVVVPDKAVMQGAQGAFVYAVKDGKAAVRPIVLGRQTDAGWLVTKGLGAGDTIVVAGVVKVRPGAPVAIDTTFANPADVKPIATPPSRAAAAEPQAAPGAGPAPAKAGGKPPAAAPARGGETRAADAR